MAVLTDWCPQKGGVVRLFVSFISDGERARGRGWRAAFETVAMLTTTVWVTDFRIPMSRKIFWQGTFVQFYWWGMFI